MPLVNEKFDQNKIDGLKRYLQREAVKQRARDYEIIVDGFKVVSRTDDVEEFEDYEQEIKDTTRNISILVYDGPKTSRNTKYSFSLSADRDRDGNSDKPTNGLGEIDQIIQQRIDEKEKDNELKNVKEKLAETLSQLEEAEEYGELLEKRLEEQEAKKFTIGNVNLVEFASAALAGVFKQHAHKIPMVGTQLSGFLNAPIPNGAPGHDTGAQSSEQEGEATFKEHMDEPPQLTVDQLRYVSNLLKMEQAFNPEQLLIMTGVINKLVEKPAHLITVAELLNVPIN